MACVPLKLVMTGLFLVLLFLEKIALYPESLGAVNGISNWLSFCLTLSRENSIVPSVSLTLFLSERFSV